MRGKEPLGVFTPRAFLEKHWQKSPCLIRQAFPGFIAPISPDELAGLACEPEAESRLVTRIRGKPGWRVRHGPFSKMDFRRLPEKHWSLLVQDTDKYLPALADFLGHFSFIPNWRIDDLMISYATDGGSVGPHVDAYDVFLLQAQGRRRWEISCKSHRPAEIAGHDLKLLKAFKPQQRFVLKPGDMLYLPPGVAHHGVALGDCMTFSIGFRTPSDVEMLADLNNVLLTRLDRETRYADAGLSSVAADPGLITPGARAAIRHRLRRAQRLKDEALDEWFGRFITEPKPWLVATPPRHKLTPTLFRRRLLPSGKLLRDPAVRLVWYRAGSVEAKLFANGQCHSLPARLSGFARLLCKERRCAAAQIKPWLQDADAIRLLVELYNTGIVHIA